mmetsp:Transcript_47525/g.103316  ORF Transcript_47525/g.103316 Transcript_47525/m.103316 type:complete len:297 (-) Transcript_47525:92-982(-)
MPHPHAPDFILLRQLRVVSRGYLSKRPSYNHQYVEIESPLVPRVKVIDSCLELHRHHEECASRRRHSARQAAWAVKQETGTESFQQACRIRRFANRAEHNLNLFGQPSKIPVEPLTLKDPWAGALPRPLPTLEVNEEVHEAPWCRWKPTHFAMCGAQSDATISASSGALPEHSVIHMFDRLWHCGAAGELCEHYLRRIQSIGKLLKPLAEPQPELCSAMCVEKKWESGTRPSQNRKVHFHDDVSFEHKTESIADVPSAQSLVDMGAFASLLCFYNSDLSTTTKRPFELSSPPCGTS